MKHLLFVLMVTACGTSMAQITIYRQRLFVENQPINKAFTFENQIPLGEQKVEFAGNNYPIMHTYHRLQGFVVPIANRENMLMSFGLGYASDRISDFPIAAVNKNEVLWYQLFGTGSIGQNYFWRSATAWGSYGKYVALENSDTYKFTQILQFGRKWNSRFATSLGALFLSNLGDALIIPIAHITYNTGPWVLDFFLPNDASVRYVKSDDLHFLVQHKINRRSYFYQSTAFRYSDSEVSVRSEIRLVGVLWAEIAISKPYGVKFEEQKDSHYTELAKNINSLIKANIGLFIRFEDK